MNIPKSYEALAADLASEKIVSKTLLDQKEAYMMLADKGRLDLSESKAREAALREELAGANRRLGVCISQIEEQQQRLTVAEKLLQRVHQADALSHCCPLWKAIDAALKPAEEVDHGKA